MAHLYNGDGGEDFSALSIAYLLLATTPKVETWISNWLSQMKPSIGDDNNTITISPGICVSNGRGIYIKKTETDSFVVPNGTQGVKTTYYLGYHIYTDSDGKQLVEKATVATTKSTATDFLNGGDEQYIYLWSAERNGATLSSVTQLVPTISMGYSTVTNASTEVAAVSGTPTDSGSSSGSSSGSTDSGSSSSESTSTTPSGTKYRCTAGTLNVRSGAGSSYSTVCQLSKNEYFYKTKESSSWYYGTAVHSGKQYKGWAYSQYLAKA